MQKPLSNLAKRIGPLMVGCILTALAPYAWADTALSNNPLYSSSNVPANLMMALSVEYPTGTVAAYGSATGYSPSSTYLGYFDPAKCYSYSTSSPPGSTTAGYFVPAFTVSIGATCANKSGSQTNYYWSGNFLNWATMTSLDEFRQAMTGGNRIVDTNSLTVLERSNLNSQSSSGNFPDRTVQSSSNVSPSTVIGDSNYAGLSKVYLRSYGQGSQLIISNNSSFSSGNGNSVTTYNVEVQVCKSGLLESNCNSAHATTDYPGAGVYNKPEGLIQQNYQQIRVGAAAYAFQQGNGAANGLVRALIQDNGPTTYNGYGARQTNPYAEWSSSTGIFATNPDTNETTGTAPGGGNATQSGAINYLNQFGYANGYETYDTIADLYWAALSYYMNVSLDSSYYTGLTSGNSLDVNFPVLTGKNLNDPIAYTCQSNAIVTIGDSHTWNDTRVPSSAPNPGGSEAALTPITQDSVTVDASAFVTALGNLPLIEKNGSTPASITMAQLRTYGSSASTSSAAGTPLGTTYEPDETTHPTYNMAGLAYYAHTNDIRSDKTNTQTVDTYTVDVLEPGPYDGDSGDEIYDPAHFNTSDGAAGPNMYWLAAKYGGFNNLNNDGVPANILTWHTNASTGTGLYPDNYFPGNRPDLLQKGLAQIFNKVASTQAQSGSNPSTGTSRSLNGITTTFVAPYYANVQGYPVYETQYVPGSWYGDVYGFLAANDSSTSVVPVTGSYQWHAQTQLDTLTQTASGTSYGWNTGRRIITWNGSTGVPFRYSSISSSEQTALNSGGSGQSLLNYLRGDRSNEGTLFRVRSHILGDIVDSQPVLVQGALSGAYSETYNPGYTQFSTNVVDREPVVYVGGNDGMLHAFEADFTQPGTNPVTGGGSELYAYVPSLLFKGPNNTPLVDGLPALANLNGVSTNNFAHHFYVDATPQVADVDFTYTSTGSYVPSSSAATSNWHTMLVGGLGKGGKGIYALDVTNVPAAVDTTSSTTVETSLTSGTSNVVRWEFTDSDMGYSYGLPLIVKTRKYGWVALATSGYDNDGSGQDGHGILYVINIQTGALIQKLDTGVGTTSNPAGLAQISAFTQNLADGTIEQVYGGDLLGNVWRFDLSEPALDSLGVVTPAYPTPTLFATLTDSSGNPQPITTAPRIAESLDSTGLGTLRWVFVGTGQFLNITDLTNTQQQTFYALRDGTGPAPSTTSLPLTRSALQANTDLTQGLVLNDSSTGWYFDLPGSAGTNGGTERVVTNPDTNTGTGTVAWATLIPSSDPCLLLGEIYATNFSGFTQIISSSGTAQVSIQVTSAPTGIQIATGTSGGSTATYVIAGSSGSAPTKSQLKGATQSAMPNRINWREILN
jgi:type IV pilus assembly protein PilY1